MDVEDEATGYLKLFNEGSQNDLLHSTEDGLNDAFPVEPIFTEITADWPAEGFPILLSGSLIADENNDSESATSNVHLLNESPENDPRADVENDHTITFFSNVDKNHLIFSNDVLLKVTKRDENEGQDNTVTRVIHGDTYSITYTQDSQDKVMETDENVEVIELLNIDGTVTTINKNSLLNIVQETPKKGQNFQNLYTQVQANKCKLCDFLCESEEDIIMHIKLKHGAGPQQSNNGQIHNGDLVGSKMTSILNVNQDKKYTLYLCSHCKRGYSNKEDLKQHMLLQHKFTEIFPPAATADKIVLEKPKLTESEQKRLAQKNFTNLVRKQKSMRHLKCSIQGCPTKFDKDESRKKHEDCHVDQNKKQFSCTVCKDKFSIWRICSMHMWKCHSIDLDLLSCPMCNEFKSYSAVRVINHMAIHKDEKPFVCETCGKSFKQLNQLRHHDIAHKPPDEIPNSSLQKQCEICDRFFANSKCLKKHIKFVHDKFKPFICNICGHQTARKEMLQLHYRQHTGDKPFNCSYCEYKTGDRNCLRKHTMRHFGVAKYSCPYCNYQSIQTSAYKIHLTTKHPGKEGTYACSVCRYTTVNCSAYLSHVRCHELELKKKVSKDEKRTNVEDSESKSSDETQTFLNTDHSEEAVDTGGITIPAGFDLQLSNDQTSLI